MYVYSTQPVKQVSVTFLNSGSQRLVQPLTNFRPHLTLEYLVTRTDQ